MLVHFETLEADKTAVKNVNDKLVERLACSDQKIVLRKHPLIFGKFVSRLLVYLILWGVASLRK